MKSKALTAKQRRFLDDKLAQVRAVMEGALLAGGTVDVNFARDAMDAGGVWIREWKPSPVTMVTITADARRR